MAVFAQALSARAIWISVWGVVWGPLFLLAMWIVRKAKRGEFIRAEKSLAS